MENLNSGKIQKGLSMFIDDMPTDLHLGFKRTVKFREFLEDVLSLINSYEDKIFALENRLKECENGYEGTIFLDRCKLHDAEEKVRELTEENERLFARNLELSEKGEQVVIAYKKLSEEHQQILNHYFIDTTVGSGTSRKKCIEETLQNTSSQL